MTPGDYPKKEYLKDNDVHAEAGDEDRTMYGGSAPATWRLGSTIRSRRSAKTDMESVARVEEDSLTMLPSATRKETAVRCVSLFFHFSSLYFHFLLTCFNTIHHISICTFVDGTFQFFSAFPPINAVSNQYSS